MTEMMTREAIMLGNRVWRSGSLGQVPARRLYHFTDVPNLRGLGLNTLDVGQGFDRRADNNLGHGW